MSKIIKYLKEEGVAVTFKKIMDKLFHKSKSHTVFFRLELSPDFKAADDLVVETLNINNKGGFEKIKFWDFVNPDDYIDNSNQSIMLYKDNGQYAAYAAEEHSIDRVIHDLGVFHLNSDEAWIGPVYVCKQWRGQGINGNLISKQLGLLSQIGIKYVYTAINSNNSSSIKSFAKNGFLEIGSVDKNGNVINDPSGILNKSFSYLEKQ